MKTLTLAVLFTLSLLLAVPARADWTGGQLLTVGAADNVKLSEDGAYALRTSVHWFWAPKQDLNLWFGYIGPRFNIADWVWTSPQIGIAGNWDPEGGDAFLASIWTGFSPHERLFLFVENDLYFYGEGVDYYGYYSLDWLPFSNGVSVAVGPTVEQVNADFIVGPHLSLYTKAGPWISAQYWVAAKSEFSHMTRFVVGLFF